MDSSRRAVEAYWRSRMVDGVTSDEEKVAPVYKLEEICDLLRTSHVSIVKEVSDYILKRLDHKSPAVKQKVLRLIKYAVGKSGVEFRREMQRHSAVMRQLFHYKGQPDPLKGDALNKAVRDTAHEAVSSIFANDDNNAVTPTEGIQKRIQGFGNTNYEMPAEEKKSFLSEVVGIGLSTIAAANTMRKSDNGSYKSPNLRRSLTTEIGTRDRYEGDDCHGESHSSSGPSKNIASGMWNQDIRTAPAANEGTVSSHTGIKSHEERLLDTIVTSGGVRLQPTRDAIQGFLMEALKLDAVGLSRALELKLQSPLWQVLSLLSGEHVSGTGNQTEASNANVMPVHPVEMPDLIDTGDPDDFGSEPSVQKHADKTIGNPTSSGSLVDLFGDGPTAGPSNCENRSEDDPFADVSFHVTEEKQHDGIFSGLTVDDMSGQNEKIIGENSGFLDVFSSNSALLQEPETNKTNVHDLMSGLSLNGTVQEKRQSGSNQSSHIPVSQSNQMPTSGALNGAFGSNSFFPMTPMQFNMPPNVMFNPAFATQPMNYGAMGAFIVQQQLLLQNLGNLTTGYGHAVGNAMDGSHASPLPDIFQPSNNPVQSHTAVITNSKKEDTKAFDFISDHLSAVRDSKRVS